MSLQETMEEDKVNRDTDLNQTFSTVYLDSSVSAVPVGETCFSFHSVVSECKLLLRVKIDVIKQNESEVIGEIQLSIVYV